MISPVHTPEKGFNEIWSPADPAQLRRVAECFGIDLDAPLVHIATDAIEPELSDEALRIMSPDERREYRFREAQYASRAYDFQRSGREQELITETGEWLGL